MMLVALTIILLPVWRKQELAIVDLDQFNIDIARQRLDELKAQLKDGVLNQAQFDAQYEELEQALSYDLSIDQLNQQSSGQGRWVGVIILIAVPVLSVLLYLLLGSPIALNEQFVNSQQQAQSNQIQIDKMVAGLEQRLQQKPDDAEGWMMLGRSYKFLQRYDKAVAAFKQAYKLLGDNPAVLLNYADSLAMAQGGQLAGTPEQLIFKALQLAPEDSTALWLAGMAKAEAGEFEAALQHWYKLEALLPQDSKPYQELQALIRQVLQQKPELAALPRANKPVPSASAVSIAVSVDLTDKLKANAKPEDVVFVYAQPLTGRKMPLAIVRKTVADLPLQVRLDDSMAMMPTMKLSNFKQVRVLARISKSGSAIPQTGDLLGVVEPVTLAADQTVDIIIDREVK